MLQNAYLVAKIGADTAENEQHFAEILPTWWKILPRGPAAARASRAPTARASRASSGASGVPALSDDTRSKQFRRPK